MRTARSCGISLYRLKRPLNIIDQITVIDKKSRKCLLIDPACPFDTRIGKKEEEKCTNYSEALFTWNGKNNTKSVGYEMTKKKKKLQYQKNWLVSAIVPFFYQEITLDLTVKK